MHLKENSLDDILFKVYHELISLPSNITPTKGPNSEIFGCLIELKNPRARLSITESRGKAFSPLGELLWYLSKSNNLDFIKYYIPPYHKASDDKVTIHGGYGPRLFNMNGHINQVDNIINLLKTNPSSRRAVIQLFDAEDLLNYHSDIPCTNTLQFTIRDDKLIMMTSMRSNDAFLGLPHDIFCFTMLQEIIAVSLNVDMGSYFHSVASLHLYEKNKDYAKQYIEEGIQSNSYVMPKMPNADPWDSLKELITLEKNIRDGIFDEMRIKKLNPYWQDFAYLLKIHKSISVRDFKNVIQIKNKINNSIYKIFINERVKSKKKIKNI